MKKLISLLFLCSLQLIAHDNINVHQRIVIEAYNLLKLQLSKENGGIADIDNYVGVIRNHDEKNWYDIKTLTGGSDHEDRQDIVFGYYGIRKYLVTGEWSHTSATHFWTVDNPTYKVYLHSWGYFESAYIKGLKYIFGDFPKIFKTYSGGLFWSENTKTCIQKNNNYLYQYYWQDKLWVESSFDVSWWLRGPHNRSSNYYWQLGNQKSKELFFNMLGRLLHVLTDMSVPEHAKNSMHPTWHEAPYEHWLSDDYNTEFYWTAEKVYKERGGFVNPFCEINGDKNLFLFYTTAQLSDIFASFGRRPTSGNLVYDKNIGEIESIYKSYFPAENESNDYKFYIRPPIGSGGFSWYPLGNEPGIKMRDALIPYTIRAVAGMLYKFIIESKMQNRYGAPSEALAGSIFDQQQELILYNQDLNGDYYTFRAEGTPGTITVCPDEIPEGYTKDFLIGPDARNVTFRAANEIVFKPGFTATHGSQVHAYTCKDCSRDNQSGNCHQCLQEDFNPQYDRSK